MPRVALLIIFFLYSVVHTIYIKSWVAKCPIADPPIADLGVAIGNLGIASEDYETDIAYYQLCSTYQLSNLHYLL